MKKRSYKTEINEISNILKKSPTLKEALSFDEDFDDMSYEEEMPMDDEMGVDMGCAPEMHQCNEKGEKLINDIRKVCLDGMRDLADCPEDPCYETFKKIWQICDKVIMDKKNPQQQQMNN
jgi:hypothetical protein